MLVLISTSANRGPNVSALSNILNSSSVRGLLQINRNLAGSSADVRDKAAIEVDIIEQFNIKIQKNKSYIKFVTENDNNMAALAQKTAAQVIAWADTVKRCEDLYSLLTYSSFSKRGVYSEVQVSALLHDLRTVNGEFQFIFTPEIIQHMVSKFTAASNQSKRSKCLKALNYITMFQGGVATNPYPPHPLVPPPAAPGPIPAIPATTTTTTVPDPMRVDPNNITRDEFKNTIINAADDLKTTITTTADTARHDSIDARVEAMTDAIKTRDTIVTENDKNRAQAALIASDIDSIKKTNPLDARLNIIATSVIKNGTLTPVQKYQLLEKVSPELAKEFGITTEEARKRLETTLKASETGSPEKLKSEAPGAIAQVPMVINMTEAPGLVDETGRSGAMTNEHAQPAKAKRRYTMSEAALAQRRKNATMKAVKKELTSQLKMTDMIGPRETTNLMDIIASNTEPDELDVIRSVVGFGGRTPMAPLVTSKTAMFPTTITPMFVRHGKPFTKADVLASTPKVVSERPVYRGGKTYPFMMV
jgi:hypothetical protein